MRANSGWLEKWEAKDGCSGLRRRPGFGRRGRRRRQRQGLPQLARGCHGAASRVCVLIGVTKWSARFGCKTGRLGLTLSALHASVVAVVQILSP